MRRRDGNGRRRNGSRRHDWHRLGRRQLGSPRAQVRPREDDRRQRRQRRSARDVAPPHAGMQRQWSIGAHAPSRPSGVPSRPRRGDARRASAWLSIARPRERVCAACVTTAVRLRYRWRTASMTAGFPGVLVGARQRRANVLAWSTCALAFTLARDRVDTFTPYMDNPPRPHGVTGPGRLARAPHEQPAPTSQARPRCVRPHDRARPAHRPRHVGV